MNTSNEEILEDENASIPNNETSSLDNETRETEVETDMAEDFIKENGVEETETVDAQIVEEEELTGEELEELLESEKEKKMNKKTKKLEEENTKLRSEIDDFKDKF